MKNFKLTKKQQQFLNNYNNAEHYSVNQAYQRPSTAKTRAEYFILQEMNDKNGYDYRITGFNSCIFSCAYKIDDENGTKLVYHTPTARNEFYIA